MIKEFKTRNPYPLNKALIQLNSAPYFFIKMKSSIKNVSTRGPFF